MGLESGLSGEKTVEESLVMMSDSSDWRGPKNTFSSSESEVHTGEWHVSSE